MVADQQTVKIGAVGPRSVMGRETRSSDIFPGVVIDGVPGFGLNTMDRGVGWHNAIRGSKEAYLREVPKLAAERGWDAVSVGGAPIELMNPGLYSDLAELLSIPVTTAMVSCSAAIKAFSAHKALLMTGFFEGLDEMLYGYYAHEGIELVWPAVKPFKEYDDAARADPEVLFNLVKETLQTAKGIELVYFQGAINSGPIVNKIETELGLPVVTSATANYWYLLSRLGKSYKIQGAERLLTEWRPLKS
jgi:hypothetical protein